jgi:hypothetical protein
MVCVWVARVGGIVVVWCGTCSSVGQQGYPKKKCESQSLKKFPDVFDERREAAREISAPRNVHVDLDL